MSRPIDAQRTRRFFQSITEIPDDEWTYAERFIAHRTFERHEHLLRAGEMAEHSFLILEGIVRVYYLTEAGKEFNKGFGVEDQVVGSVSSIIGGLPSRFSIQALEPTSAALLPRRGIEELYERHRCWDRLGRVIAEASLVTIERQHGERLDPLEVRYRRLMETFPDLPKRVAQYHIASYLGITDVALSRLRGRMRARGALTT